jgi:hypothetical protein
MKIYFHDFIHSHREQNFCSFSLPLLSFVTPIKRLDDARFRDSLLSFRPFFQIKKPTNIKMFLETFVLQEGVLNLKTLK